MRRAAYVTKEIQDRLCVVKAPLPCCSKFKMTAFSKSGCPLSGLPLHRDLCMGGVV